MATTPKHPGTSRPNGSFLGLTTVDVIFGFDRYPIEDTKNTARHYTVAAGGPASNAAVVFSYLGGMARLVSSLGKSPFSAIARADLAGRGVQHIDLTPDRDADPALSAITIAEDSGSRTILTSPAIDDDSPGLFNNPDELGAIVTRADILLLDGHRTSLAVDAARLARSAGVPVILDGDLYRPNLESLFPLVDMVIFGKSFTVPGNETAVNIFAYLGSFGIKHMIATHGHNPIVFMTDGVLGRAPVDSVMVVDTLGAGDFFHGAFCYNFAVHRDIDRAIRFGAKVAARSVASFGTRHWMTQHEPSSFE